MPGYGDDGPDLPESVLREVFPERFAQPEAASHAEIARLMDKLIEATERGRAARSSEPPLEPQRLASDSDGDAERGSIAEGDDSAGPEDIAQ